MLGALFTIDSNAAIFLGRSSLFGLWKITSTRGRMCSTFITRVTRRNIFSGPSMASTEKYGMSTLSSPKVYSTRMAFVSSDGMVG